MIIDKKQRSESGNLNSYIESLENYIESFDASNIKKLLTAIDTASGILADDITLLSSNESDDEIDNRLQMLGSKKNKSYERFLALVKQVKDFKAVDEVVRDLKPKRASKEVSEPKQVADAPVKKLNIQDFAINGSS